MYQGMDCYIIHFPRSVKHPNSKRNSKDYPTSENFRNVIDAKILYSKRDEAIICPISLIPILFKHVKSQFILEKHNGFREKRTTADLTSSIHIANPWNFKANIS